MAKEVLVKLRAFVESNGEGLEPPAAASNPSCDGCGTTLPLPQSTPRPRK